MKVNVNACMKCHTKEMNHTLPLDLTYSLPLHLWHQAPKPKGRTAGQEQSSQALRCDERSETELHHPLTLNSEWSDPLKLEVKVKRSRSTQ